jgi:hypothetical protein
MQGQVVYEPVTNNSVYDLLDELSTLKVITLISVTKPYSRIYITGKLAEARHALADTTITGVKKRLKEEIDFFLRDYVIELRVLNNELRITNPYQPQHSPFRTHDSPYDSIFPSSRYQVFNNDPIGYTYLGKLLNLSVRPELGNRFLVNENGNVWEATGGGEVFGYLGKHIGFYANVKQTRESEPLVKPEYFTMEEGKVWKELKNGSVSNTEWRGGLSVVWNWGDFGVYNDRPIWGNSQHGSNILSGHVPSFPFFQLNVKPAKWIELRYILGLLQSVYLDSIYQDSKTPKSNRTRKYFIGNLVTVIPWKSLHISVGNSVIYGDRAINPAFFIPFLFYKSVDQTQSNLSVDNGQNNQMFLNINYLAVRCLLLYSSVFIDDLKMEAFWKAGQHNEISSKIGFQLAGWPLKNLILVGEYTRTNPLTYQHYVTPIDYYSSGYCLGNYLKDNSEELFFSLIFRPYSRVALSGEYQYIRHGQDFLNIRYLNNYTLPVLKDISFQTDKVQISINFLLCNQFMLNGGISYQHSKGDIKYAPIIFYGITYSIFFGFQIGF